MSRCGLKKTINGGEFIFRTPEGKEVGRARNIAEFEQMLWEIPLSSLFYHLQEKHFISWLKSIGEEEIAQNLEKGFEDLSLSDLPLLLSISRRLTCDCCE